MDDELSLTLSILRFHTGEANAISAKQLARDLGFSEKDTRTVRAIIHELREQGESIIIKGQPVKVPVPVLGSAGGYFLPENLNEVTKFCDKLMNHAITEIVTRGNILEASTPYFENASARRMF
jgi:hypothetical protein